MSKAPMTDEKFDLLSEQAARAENVVPDHEMDYDDWLEWTGKDDSFVGSYEFGIPGTGDIYDAAIRIYRRENGITDDEENTADAAPGMRR